MKPWAAQGLTDRQWALAEPGRNYLVYSARAGSIRLDLSGTQETFTAYRVNLDTGERPGPRTSGADRRSNSRSRK